MMLVNPQCPCFSAPSLPSFFHVCRPLPALPSQMFSFFCRSRPSPLLPGRVTLLPSRKSLSAIWLAGCDDFGGLAETNQLGQINDSLCRDKLCASVCERASERASPLERLHNPQCHLIHLTDGVSLKGWGGLKTDNAGRTH